MKKKLVLLGIHLTVVALVLILTMVTLAWYTKSETGEATNAVITAEPINDIVIEELVDNVRHYSGETGLGGRDAPYIATKIMAISQESKHVGDAVICYLSDIYVTLPDGETKITSETKGFEDILDAFTFRVIVVEIDAEMNVTNEKGVFYPSENGVLVDSNDEVLCFQNDAFFTITDNGSSKTCSTTIQLQLIFLDEQSYDNYPNNTEEITPFRFSSYDYMGSTFHAWFALGKEEGSISNVDPTPEP